ncbi:MAG: SPOR domain-containing protein, partial [Pontixanthobacter sp.]
VAHRTLPMPSYVEITALDTGKTILARVERRGPMSGHGVVALSAGARQQLEVGASAPIRIRRVNAAESDRSKLRVGEAAPDRMDTPKSLLAVLKRKLPVDGAVSLASAQQSVPAAQELPANPPKLAAANPPSAHVVPPPAPKAAVVQAAKPGNSFEQAFSTAPKAVKSYPLPPLGGQQISKAPAPVRVAAAPVAAPKVTPVEKPNIAAPVADVKVNFVIQAAAFSSKANAQRVADSIDGFVQQSGSLYRVRKGPFANRGQAEAALAKVRAAGYSDARVFTAG